MKKNPIGIYEKAIPNCFDWADKIRIAKEAGFDFIEMSVDESDERLARLKWSKEYRMFLRKLLAKNDFEIRSMCLSAHRRFPYGSKKEETRKKAYQIMTEAITLAKDLGIRNIQLAGYDVYYEPADEETKRLFKQGLRQAVKEAAAANIMLSIEIMDTEFIGTITRCMEYIEEIRSPWLQIYPDLGNLSRWTDNPVEELKLGWPHIVAIHLKDTQPNVFKCVPFGEGTVDFAGLLSKIKEWEYSGPFLIEMWADNEKETDRKEAIHQIRLAKEWLSERAGGMF